MKKIILLAAFAAISISAIAIPARPFWRNFTQPDGTVVEVRLVGDEFGHAYVDRSGNVLRPDSDGYLRPVDASEVRAARKAAAAKRMRANAARVRSKAPVKVAGTPHVPVLLVEFSDIKFKSTSGMISYSWDPKTAFTNLLNQSGYSYNGASGSVKDFYTDNSNGIYIPTFDVFNKVTLTNGVKTYGANNAKGDDTAPELAVYEAVKALDATIDFSQYDQDHDGEIDMILMYYAGENEAEAGSSDTIWPHQWNVQESTQKDGKTTLIKDVRFDGKKLGKYFCTSELSAIHIEYDDEGNPSYDLALCGIGTTCHEFAHSLGLPDFYDTDYEDNYMCGGTYAYDTMCEGSYNNEGNTPSFFGAEELLLLGWMDSLTDLPPMGHVTIPALSKTNKVAYKGDSSTEGEYFVFECRGDSSWDSEIKTGSGLIVYHVDKSSREISFPSDSDQESAYNLWTNWEATNAINAAGQHPCYYIIPAGCQNYNYDRTNNGSYYGNPTENTGLHYSGTDFTFGRAAKYSSYSPVDWNKATMDYKLKNISYSNGQVSFDVSADICFISVPASLTAGATLPLSLDGAPSGAKVAWFWDDTALAGSSVVLTSGKHLIEAKVTSGKTTTRIELEVVVD